MQKSVPHHTGYAFVDDYRRVRELTLSLTAGFSEEDMMLQSMPEASPVKWHLAHTTWFFENFLLQRFFTGYRCFSTVYNYLFNSYYDAVGKRTPRHQRGLLSRPSLSEVLAYRDHVDNAMVHLLEDADARIARLTCTGLHHEMQHQELILTDIKHALFQNPYAFGAATTSAPALQQAVEPAGFTDIAGGIARIGNSDKENFSYDCEQPAHRVLLNDFSIANAPVTNGEWLQFIDDGGYQRSELWLSDGWTHCVSECWNAPLYWQNQDEQWQYMTLQGFVAVDPQAPVCHISFYEAAAFARWSGRRLPTEFEWERVAIEEPVAGNFLENGHWCPVAENGERGIRKMYGDVWEWTNSSFLPYPGFKTEQGALGEYNGKFMMNQMVLRGGSCATPVQQMRASYRNFFYPHQRWQFSGLRLAG